MANLTIEMPDDLVRRLEGIASVQRKSVQQLALDQLQSLAEAGTGDRPVLPRRHFAQHASPHTRTRRTWMIWVPQSHPRAFPCE